MLNVAMLSGWHVHAEGYARELMNLGVKVPVIWDEIPERGQKWADKIGAKFVSDLNTVLEDDSIQGVAICAPTNMHPEIIKAAAKAGKHIFTEKVLALTVKECEEIAAAIEESGVKFCISFPFRTMPQILFAKKVVDEKLLGDITLLRVRNAHDGATRDWLPDHFYNEVETGGGAMIDLGAHPMYICSLLLGKPVSISSTFNSYTDHSVEDNAVSVIEFENKAIAISETGFVTARSPFSLEINGTDGTLFIGGADNNVRIQSNKLNTEAVSGWTTVTRLPEKLPSALQQWVDGILKDTEIIFGIKDAIALTQLMEGAYKAHREGKKIMF